VVRDLYVDVDSADVSGAVEFRDITNLEDYHVVGLQQQGHALAKLGGRALLEPGGVAPRPGP
jgi:SAM-dependent MidA family methyltransferase